MSWLDSHDEGRRVSEAEARLVVRYSVSIVIWMAVVFPLTVVGRSEVFLHQWLHGPVLYLVAAAPCVPLGAVLLSAARFFRDCDEYVRALMSRRLLLAGALTLFLACVWGFLEGMPAVPVVPIWAVAPAYWVVFALVTPLIRKV